MKQEGLRYFTDTHLTALGLLIFFVFFVGVLIWVYRKHSKELYQHLEQIPLKGE
ncbi:cbb3-type cytochrome c oxidase subunit 3 [Bdellovibrio sp. 22V]|uniref:cbb3-type cytochrome oxidase subunit 3 n=1 Tax=Bdellovibrio TaxID=958 RepID=UPI002542C2C7|nr:cbb3-type cytochrome c oxidase subunit 3 [Bdellovibrio sp. 22V]WII73652.1 cbb3-type cytochrome c oxidase subunit 3 [Bdellovibrio sp. 22V]